MVKRIALFVITNIMVMITITVVLRVLGIGNYLTPYGLDYSALAAFCLVWGFAGAFISLAISRIMAKMFMGVKVVDPNNPGQYSGLVEMVHRLSREAGLPAMPEVGIYESPEVNAFATGPTKSRSLVAVSTGLLRRMDRDQVEGVIGHEVAHIANGDMVTMTLVQGVVNAFVMFFARVLAYAISQALARGERASPMVHFVLVMVFQIALSFLGMFIVSWFSRQREFRADASSARLAGRHKMVSALQGLMRNQNVESTEDQGALATLKIHGRGSRLMSLLSTHPPLEERIARLQAGI